MSNHQQRTPRPHASQGYQGQNRGARPSYNNQKRQNSQPRIDTSKIIFGDKIDPELYAKTAEVYALAIGRDRNVKATQARRFYNEVVMWDEKIRQHPNSFDENLPLIMMMKAKLAYAEGRRNINKDFQAMLNAGLNQIKDPKTLNQFKLFFEAFMGFFKQHGPKA